MSEEENFDPETEEDDDVEDVEEYSSVGDNIAESVLSFIAYTILSLGIAASVLIGLVLIFSDFSYLRGIGFAILIGGPIASIIVWASSMIVINISNNIRQIKHELRRKQL